MTNNFMQPPHNLSAEQAVLGGLMLSTDDEKRYLVTSLIKAGSFYQGSHQRIYAEIVKLIKSNKPTDIITVSDSLKENGELTNVGGFAYIAELCQLPTTANIVSYAKIVRDKSIQRYAIDNLNSCIEMMMANDGIETNIKLSHMQQMISQLIEHARTGKSKGLRPAKEVIGDWLNEVERRFADPHT